MTAYLFDASGLVNRHLVVQERREPLCDVPQMVIGSKPIDGGNYIFTTEEMQQFLRRQPDAERYLHPYIGSEEFINGGVRWILNLERAAPEDLRAMPAVMERIAAVRKMRSESKSEPTQFLADTPTRFHVTVIPEGNFLVIPKVSSERRQYVPIGYLSAPTIPSDLLFVLPHADLWHFAILTSAMHMAWLRQIGGRLESRYRYSIGIVYNTFVWPNATDEQRDRVRSLAQAILDARAEFPNSSRADLYDTDVMPRDLRKAHRDLDLAVDKLYRLKAFSGDRDRVEQLFALYEKSVAPRSAVVAPRSRRRAKRIR